MLRSHVHPTAVHEQDDQARTADPSGRADDHPGATAPPQHGATAPQQHGATAPQQHGATAPQQHTSPESSPDASGALVQLLAPDGTRTSDPEYEAWVEDVDAARLVDLYEDLVVVRRLDVEATALQRQGQLGLWPPLLGQEAAQVGSARVLRTDDFVFSSYRENAVAYCRGVDLTDMVKVWRGTANSGWDPFAVGMATPQIIIGAQTLHATGWAIGAVKDGTDAAAVAYFGDGATSQGDVNEAMVFAASFRAPVVFFCQNNQWAISEPVGLQAVRPIADRAPGFGIPSVRVDGNDVLAVMAVTRRALDRARRGDGPTFVEAVTYRMGPHTTSDDPTRYVDPADREVWAQRDPLLRVERLLEREGLLDDQVSTRVKHAADAAARGMRAGCLGLTAPEPLSVFDHVYATPSTWLERQRSQYAAYLAMYADDDPAPAATAPATGTGVPGEEGAR